MGGPALKASAHRKQKDVMLASITSPVPTRYVLIENGRPGHLYVYCALDTLEYAWLTARSYRMKADPPAGGAMEFRLSLSGPEPSIGWMSSVIPDRIARLPDVKGMPSRCCPYVHFFASKNAYADWNRSLPKEIRTHIECLSLDQAWQKARCVLGVCETSGRCDC